MEKKPSQDLFKREDLPHDMAMFMGNIGSSKFWVAMFETDPAGNWTGKHIRGIPVSTREKPLASWEIHGNSRSRGASDRNWLADRCESPSLLRYPGTAVLAFYRQSSVEKWLVALESNLPWEQVSSSQLNSFTLRWWMMGDIMGGSCFAFNFPRTASPNSWKPGGTPQR